MPKIRVSPDRDQLAGTDTVAPRGGLKIHGIVNGLFGAISFADVHCIKLQISHFLDLVTRYISHPRLQGYRTARSEQPHVPGAIKNYRHPKDRMERLLLRLMAQHLLCDKATRPTSNQRQLMYRWRLYVFMNRFY